MQNRAFCLNIMQEVWKAIPGYEGRYEVSDQGRVRSFVKNKLGVIRKQTRSVYGHMYVSLGRGVNVTVHSLVLRAFLSERPLGYECCHNDGNPANNFLGNLRWDTHRENIRDIFRQAANKSQKLTPTQVLHIKQSFDQEGAAKLAQQYGVTLKAITDVKKGRTYAYIVA